MGSNVIDYITLLRCVVSGVILTPKPGYMLPSDIIKY